MNRNHMLKRKMTAGLAVGMAVAVGSVPMAMAANTVNTTDSSSSVSKEETVYVNADASGNPQQITVSNWLKNAGSESNVEDQSDLTNIKNVKGDETFSENGDSLTWNTDGSDIYYQGQSNKNLPVSVKFTYLLDGQEMQPQDLVGKSGHLQIKIQYTNNEKKSAKVDGKNETIYSPFVMLTAMILPDDTFSNVTIDNGKVISDGSRNIVVGVGMPGLKDSLKLDTIDLSAVDDKNSEDKTLDIDIPDSVSIEADVTDFSMSSSLTVALSDLLKDIDFDDDRRKAIRSNLPFRIKHESWWEQELPSEEELEEGRKNLAKHGYKVDYVLTHCCATKIQELVDKGPGHLYSTDVLTDFLQEVEEKLEYKHWYFGHYHMELDVDDKHSLLYHAIIPVEGYRSLAYVPVPGRPRYHRDEMVRIKWDDAEKVGKVFVVDAFGTIDQNEEPSYDILVEEDNCLYKHICESDIIGKILM